MSISIALIVGSQFDQMARQIDAGVPKAQVAKAFSLPVEKFSFDPDPVRGQRCVSIDEVTPDLFVVGGELKLVTVNNYAYRDVSSGGYDTAIRCGELGYWRLGRGDDLPTLISYPRPIEY
jgi:hypothetical protein